MSVADILKTKGSTVVSVLPSDTIESAARVLSDRRVGAVVVRDRRGKLAGILWERDVVRALAEKGAGCLALHVEDLMTKEIKTCKPSEPIKDLMVMMTKRHQRHVPVLDDAGELMGIVSIGDVVKARIDEQAHEVAVLRDLNLVMGSH